MFSPEERQRVVELYFTTPMTTAQVVRHLGYPTRQCLERWLAKDPRYAGHMAKPIIPLETRTKAIELVLGGMQQKQAAERLGVSVGAVHNWVKAYREGGMAYAERFAEEERTLSVEMIQKLHEVTALDMQPALRGRFRPYGFQARITATRVKTADPLEIYEDMEALVDAVNGSKDHPILKAAGFHAMFENIHPFTDGNGRTGRQILNLMLMAAGYRPVAIKHDAGRSYGKSLEAWQVDGDPKPFISQLVQCVDQEERAVAEIVGRLRENPFSENAIDGIGLEDGPARGRSL